MPLPNWAGRSSVRSRRFSNGRRTTRISSGQRRRRLRQRPAASGTPNKPRFIRFGGTLRSRLLSTLRAQIFKRPSGLLALPSCTNGIAACRSKASGNPSCYDCNAILAGGDDIVTRSHENQRSTVRGTSQLAGHVPNYPNSMRRGRSSATPCSESRRGSWPWKVRSKASRNIRTDAEKPGRVWCADSFRPGTIGRSNADGTGSATSMTSGF
jgi:hypothetical protein